MRISYTRKELKNIGNFENISIEIGAEQEVGIEFESDLECYERLKSFVDNQIKIEMANIAPTGAADVEKASYSDMQSEARNSIQELLNRDKSNKKVVKAELAEYDAIRIGQLTEDEIKEFNLKLKRLLRGQR